MSIDGVFRPVIAHIAMTTLKGRQQATNVDCTHKALDTDFLYRALFIEVDLLDCLRHPLIGSVW